MNHRLTSAARRWVLGAAFTAGLAAWLVPQALVVIAAPAVDVIRLAQTETKAGKAAGGPASAKDAAKSAVPAEKAADADGAEKGTATKDDDDTNIEISPRGVKIDKGKKRVHVAG
jgi:hypothetical protein